MDLIREGVIDRSSKENKLGAPILQVRKKDIPPNQKGFKFLTLPVCRSVINTIFRDWNHPLLDPDQWTPALSEVNPHHCVASQIQDLFPGLNRL